MFLQEYASTARFNTEIDGYVLVTCLLFIIFNLMLDDLMVD